MAFREKQNAYGIPTRQGVTLLFTDFIFRVCFQLFVRFYLLQFRSQRFHFFRLFYSRIIVGVILPTALWPDIGIGNFLDPDVAKFRRIAVLSKSNRRPVSGWRVGGRTLFVYPSTLAIEIRCVIKRIENLNFISVHQEDATLAAILAAAVDFFRCRKFQLHATEFLLRPKIVAASLNDQAAVLDFPLLMCPSIKVSTVKK